MIRLILLCIFLFYDFYAMSIADAIDLLALERLLDVCHGQRSEREGQLVLFLVFEHLEQDLSGYIESLPSSGMPNKTIQVCL